MYEEINRFAILLGESVNSYLEDIVDTKCDYLPLTLAFVAKACYVKCDTQLCLFFRKIHHSKIIKHPGADSKLAPGPISAYKDCKIFAFLYSCGMMYP